ncbi:MAG: glycosyl hydrolase 108 family protein [Desulfovibrionaceae bacterium]
MTTANFAKAHAFTAQWEGGLTDHPSDPGGITHYGVSLRWLRSLGHDLGDIDGDGDIDADDIRALTPDQAAALFKAKFWDTYNLSGLPQLTATLHYDCTVNTGPRQATLIAQRACNTLVGPYGVKLEVDGALGPKTRKFLTLHATPILATAMIEQRKGFYLSLVHDKPDFAPFERGWINRTNALQSYVRKWV